MKQINTLLLTNTHFDPTADQLVALQKEFPMLKITLDASKTYEPHHLLDAEVVLGFPRTEELKDAKSLKWLQTASSGIAQYVDRSLYANEDVLLSNAVGTYGRAIADHVLGMVIGFNHQLFKYRDQMKQQLWQRYFPTKDLWDSTMLVIGFGDLGQSVARMAKAHSMRTIVVKRTATAKPDYVDHLYTTDELDAVIGEADYLVICAASTDETAHLIDQKRLGLMKKGSYLINVSRGNIVDQDALIAALENGHLGGAGLDVTTPEPLPADNPLCQMDNVMISPHSSGLSVDCSDQIYELFKENLRRYLARDRLKNQIDFDRGY